MATGLIGNKSPIHVPPMEEEDLPIPEMQLQIDELKK